MKKKFSVWWITFAIWIFSGIADIVKCTSGAAADWTSYWFTYAVLMICMCVIAIIDTCRRL